jgi:DNA repair exonuclease SbcCD ATPase subunit
MGNKESTPKQYTIEEIFTKDITDKLITLEDYRALYFLLEYEDYYDSCILFNKYFIIQCQDIRSIKKNIVDRKFNNCYKPLDKNILIQTIDKINKSLKYVIKIILEEKDEKLKKKLIEDNYELIEKNEDLEEKNEDLEEKNEKEINYFKEELKKYEKIVDSYKKIIEKNKVLQIKYNILEEENAKLRERVKILDESNF